MAKYMFQSEKTLLRFLKHLRESLLFLLVISLLNQLTVGLVMGHLSKKSDNILFLLALATISLLHCHELNNNNNNS